MSDLDPEDPDDYWYHENVATVAGRQIRLEKSPRVRRANRVFASASDGGFYTFSGTIRTTRIRTLARLRLVACDYCAEYPALSQPFIEHSVRWTADGAFELNNVRYRAVRDPKLTWRPECADCVP